MEILHKTTGEILFKNRSKTIASCVKAALKAEADLQGVNLRGADLQGADLQWADLQGADLQWADLQGVNLQGVNLREANLQEADLQGANLQGADLDFSSGFTFACKTFGIKADKKLAAQMAYHFCKFEFDDDEAKAAQAALHTLANKFHRVNECGLIDL